MIPRETGPGLSISGAHRVAAVERLVGATLVVALPLNGATTVRRPLLGHYRTGGGGAATFYSPTGTGVRSGVWSGVVLGADWDRRPSGRRAWRRGAATQPRNDATPQGTHKGCPYGLSGISLTGRLETALPVGDWKSPLRASGMIPRETGRGDCPSAAPTHRVAAVERLAGATLVVALPLNGATTVRRPLLGHYRTGGVERRLSSRRLGSASGAASSSAPTGTGVLPGAGNGDMERRHSRGTMRPRRAPTRGAPTVIGDWKFQ